MPRLIHAFATIAFLASALVLAQVSATEYLDEDEAEEAIEKIGKWAEEYYLHPQPKKLPEMLELMLRLPRFKALDEYDEEEAEDIFIENPEAESRARAAMALALILHETPEHVAKIMEGFGDRGWVEQEFLILMIFLSDTAEGREALEKLTKAPEAERFHRRIEQLLKGPQPGLDDFEHMGVDTCWMIFSVTGDEKTVLRVIDIIEAEKNAEKESGYTIVSGAAWSLRSMAQQERRVREIIAKEIEKRDEEMAAFLRDVLEPKKTPEKPETAPEEKPTWEEPDPVRPEKVKLGRKFSVDVSKYAPGDRIELYAGGPGDSSYRYGGEKSLVFRASRDGTCFFRLDRKKRTLIGVAAQYGERAARAVLLSLTDEELHQLHDLTFRLRERDPDRVLAKLDPEKVHLTIVRVHTEGSLPWATEDSSDCLLPHNRWRYLELPGGSKRWFKGVEHLTALEELVVGEIEQTGDISFLAPLKSLRKLEVRGSAWLTDISVLASLTELRDLDLSNCYNLRDLRPLESLTKLWRLNLEVCSRLRDLRPLAGLANLRSLNLEHCHSLKNIEPLAHIRALECLSLGECRRINDVSALAGAENLRELDLSGTRVKDLSPIAGLTKLDHLNLTSCPAPQDRKALAKVLKGNHLKVLGLPRMITDDDLKLVAATQSQLESLEIWGCELITDISPLAELKSLRRLVFEGCPKVRNISAIGELPQLRWLELQLLQEGIDVRPLVKLRKLERFFIRGPTPPEYYRKLRWCFPKGVLRSG